MQRKIEIKSGTVTATAELNESRTARSVWNAMPIKARVDTWGDEIYFRIPVHEELENGQELVKEGDLGFWPEGDAFCIFFGQTPISQKNEIRPASAVTVLGKITGNARIFKKISSGSEIEISKKEQADF